MASYRSTLTRKGQATIPVEIREKMGLKEGDRLVWWEEDGTVHMLSARDYVKRMRAYFESLHAPNIKPLTIEELNEARARAWTERHERAMVES